MRIPLTKSLRLPLSKTVLILMLAGLVCLGALPGYLTGGKWRWTAPPAVAVLSNLKTLKKDGLQVIDWQTIDLQTPVIGDHRWVQQTITNPTQIKATVLLFPQARSIDQPQVEWTNLDGAQAWKTDSNREVTFTASEVPVTVEFLRAWTPTQTYAVMRWYAWSSGGHSAPSRWFIADRLAQWQNRRAAWVAVAVLLPIEPLDDIEKYRTSIQSIAQVVQSSLMQQVLRSNV